VSSFYYFVLCLGLGVAATMARMVYFFSPIFNILDVICFGSIGALVVYNRPRRWWLWVLASIAPTMVLLARILSRLGIEDLKQRIGTGHLVSAILIPIAAALAGVLAARISIRTRPTVPE
jgi:hypothetical protein